MKNLKPYFVIIVFISIVVVVFISMSHIEKMIVVKEGNSAKLPLEIQLNHYQDSDCGMVITDLTYASQAIAPDGKTWFFHDLGGMVHWLSTKKFKDNAVMWVYTKDTHTWISYDKAWYSRDDDTPMGYGFGAYENYHEGLIDYESMRQYMLRGETMNNPYIKAKLHGDH